MSVLFLKPVFHFPLRKVFSDLIVTLYFASLYFSCCFRKKGLSTSLPRFLSRILSVLTVSAGVLNIRGTLGTRLPNCLCFCIIVLLCIQKALFLHGLSQKDFPSACFFCPTLMVTGKGFVEVHQIFFFLSSLAIRIF